jgi:nucleotide-binding universal stress UspA family protein
MTTPERPADVILVPLDGSPTAEQALYAAGGLATDQTRVLLLRVLPESPTAHARTGRTVPDAPELLARVREAALADLHGAAERLTCRTPASTTEPMVVVGDPAEQILRVARERGANLIVMASRGLTSGPEAGFGSVTDRVMRTSEVPTLVVHPEGMRIGAGMAPFRRILVPLDGSETSLQALPTARALARRLDVPIHLVSVIDAFEQMPPALVYEATLTPGLADELFAGIRLETQQMLERASAGCIGRGIPATWEALSGATAACLLDAMRPGDLVVMTSHGRSHPHRWMIGSVAEKLIRAGDVPVRVLRPGPTSEAVVRIVADMAEPRPAAPVSVSAWRRPLANPSGATPQ